MTKRTIFNKHFLHYFYLDRDIKKAVERYSYTDGWTLDAGCGESPYKEMFLFTLILPLIIIAAIVYLILE